MLSAPRLSACEGEAFCRSQILTINSIQLMQSVDRLMPAKRTRLRPLLTVVLTIIARRKFEA